MYPVHNTAEEQYRSEQGFTLIELLVATAIFAIGMLALAALQGEGLRFNGNAYERSQAVLLASDMADRIRANVDVTGQNALNYGAIAGAPGAAASCVGVNCTPAQMATADRFEWLTLIAQTLPGGTGAVTCSSGPCVVGDTYLITVSWTGRFGAANHSLSVLP